MKKGSSWLVVASSSEAQFFKIENQKNLIPIHNLSHQESRLRNLEIVSDKPGRTFDRVGGMGSRHGVGSEITPKEHEAQVFAKEVIDFLTNASDKNEFDHLYIVAGAKFLGLLRSEYTKGIKAKLSGEMDKELVHFNSKEILEHVQKIF